MARTAAQKKPTDADVLSLKVTLRHIRPPIWRRILVPRDMTLADLHRAIQAVMGWEDAHLHSFSVGGRQYSDPAMLPDAANEARVTLNSLARSGTTRFTYTYDFGDDWEHDILIEKRPPATAAKAYPACVAGKRNCPPEDCGGPWGYEELLAALADPNHPEHAERLEWLGEAFDPEDFAVAHADVVLGAAFRRPRPPAVTD
jgi:Plasmid pRiA4b ORF-3-like protein